MKKIKNILRTFKWILLVILFTVGFFLTFTNQITNYLIESYHPVVYQTDTHNVDTPYEWSNVKPLTLKSVVEARIYHPHIKVIGGIYNEKLGLDVPIVNRVNNSIYALCAGVLKPHEQMGKGNYTLAGHNLKGDNNALLSPLYNKAKIGDILYVTNFNQVYSYRITAKKTISSYNNTILAATTKPTLTLITCNPNNSKRVEFTAKLINEGSYNNLSFNTKSYINEKYSLRSSRWDTININSQN